MQHSIGIIGGADGPTAIFVATPAAGFSAFLPWIAAGIVIAVLLIRYFRKRK